MFNDLGHVAFLSTLLATGGFLVSSLYFVVIIATLVASGAKSMALAPESAVLIFATVGALVFFLAVARSRQRSRGASAGVDRRDTE